jgi:dual specificity phosphatase 12
VFTEPLAWMCGQVVGPVQGKLYCPNCQARLGSFNWAGEGTVSHSS